MIPHTLLQSLVDNRPALEQSTSSWTTMVAVNGHELVFKLDTGADVTIISDDTFKSLNIEDQELQSSYKRLGGQTASP